MSPQYVGGDEHEDDDKKVDHAEPQDSEGKDEWQGRNKGCLDWNLHG